MRKTIATVNRVLTVIWFFGCGLFSFQSRAEDITLTQLPQNTVVSLRVKTIVLPQVSTYDLPELPIHGAPSNVQCSFDFNSSGDARNLEGQLQFVSGTVKSAEQIYSYFETRAGNFPDITGFVDSITPNDVSLDGKKIQINVLRCTYTDRGSSQGDVRIEDFVKYINKLKGTVTLPPPTHF